MLIIQFKQRSSLLRAELRADARLLRSASNPPLTPVSFSPSPSPFCTALLCFTPLSVPILSSSLALFVLFILFIPTAATPLHPCRPPPACPRRTLASPLLSLLFHSQDEEDRSNRSVEARPKLPVSQGISGVSSLFLSLSLSLSLSVCLSSDRPADERNCESGRARERSTTTQFRLAMSARLRVCLTRNRTARRSHSSSLRRFSRDSGATQPFPPSSLSLSLSLSASRPSLVRRKRKQSREASPEFIALSARRTSPRRGGGAGTRRVIILGRLRDT